MPRWVIAFLFVFAGCMTTPSVNPPADIGFSVTGYHVWWLGSQWDEADVSLLDRLFIFEVQIGIDGVVANDHAWPRRWVRLIETAKEHDVAVYPTLTLTSEAAFDSLFLNPVAVDQLIATSVDLVKAGEADGLHVDFEVFQEVDPAARAAFSDYLRRVKLNLLRADASYELIVFLPAFDYPDAFDEVAIAQASDLLVIQGYDMHWAAAPRAGPVAPLGGWDGQNWEGILRRYANLNIPREKMLMAAPYYGYEWPTKSDSLGAPTRGVGRTLPYASAYTPEGSDAGKGAVDMVVPEAIRRDTLSGSPYYTVYRDGGWWQGWFEDSTSLRLKYDYVRQEGLAGVAIFALGYDEGQLRSALWAE